MDSDAETTAAIRLAWPGKASPEAILRQAAAGGMALPPLVEHFLPDAASPGLLHEADNLAVMAGLLAGEKLQLVYMDPPFAVGDVFAVRLPDGGKAVAYDDRWPGGDAAFLSMIHPRLVLARELLHGGGLLCLHCDNRMAGYFRSLLDEIFGRALLVNEIIWSYGQGGANRRRFGAKHDTILVYAKSREWYFDETAARIPFTPHKHDQRGRNYGGNMGVDEAGRPYVEKWGTGRKRKYRYYLDEGKQCPDVWTDIPSLQSAAGERTGYPTQKPLALLHRLITAFSRPGDLVGDFFCGSGTTALAAAAAQRRWIAADQSPLAIHHTRLRLLREGIPHQRHSPPPELETITCKAAGTESGPHLQWADIPFPAEIIVTAPTSPGDGVLRPTRAFFPGADPIPCSPAMQATDARGRTVALRPVE